MSTGKWNLLWGSVYREHRKQYINNQVPFKRHISIWGREILNKNYLKITENLYSYPQTIPKIKDKMMDHSSLCLTNQRRFQNSKHHAISSCNTGSGAAAHIVLGTIAQALGKSHDCCSRCGRVNSKPGRGGSIIGSSHPFIIDTAYPLRVTVELEPVAADSGWETGH